MELYEPVGVGGCLVLAEGGLRYLKAATAAMLVGRAGSPGVIT